MKRNLTYFVSDVHLGLQAFDPADREARFVKFLRELPEETDVDGVLSDLEKCADEITYIRNGKIIYTGNISGFAGEQGSLEEAMVQYEKEGLHEITVSGRFDSGNQAQAIGNGRFDRACVFKKGVFYQ